MQPPARTRRRCGRRTLTGVSALGFYARVLLFSLVIPVLGLVSFWIQGQMSLGKKLLGTLVLAITFVGPTLAGATTKEAIMAQAWYWVGARSAIAAILFLWAKVSEMPA